MSGNKNTQDKVVTRDESSSVSPRFFDRYFDPVLLNQMSLMRHHLNEVFSDVRSNPWGVFHLNGGADGSSIWMPSVDVCESNNMISVSAELPGIPKENVKTSVVDNRLIISGEKKQELVEKDLPAGVHRSECSYGKFERSFALPRSAILDQISAKMDDGVLKVQIPKRPDSAFSAHMIDIK
ncbi:hypothetical protein BB561_002396 [Smittium simulii]|uniref:SHSP domain-containing protein n=1 Tax=Smittium simulii TaxID=133385 RepID=A0A2T9YQK8_9FUNG|nr:hypothetical protein BB561_002396 [Smittium simulii]